MEEGKGLITVYGLSDGLIVFSYELCGIIRS